MKKRIKLFLFAILAILAASCTRVEPNHAGVLMENYGKNGKSDFSVVTGSVSTIGAGTTLYQCPLWEQRADFGDRVLHLKSSDNTEYTATPKYSYCVIKERAVDVVFNNSQLDDENFLKSIEDNVIEPKMYDLIKEECRKYLSDSLMSTGGGLKFEYSVQKIIKHMMDSCGLKLVSFSCQLDFTAKVKDNIDKRNESNANLATLDQQILEQKKRNELEELKTKQNKIKSEGLTKEILTQNFIDAWKETKQPIYGDIPLMKAIQ